MTHTEPDTTTQATLVPDEAEEAGEPAASALVEDVSIDGMCGVY